MNKIKLHALRIVTWAILKNEYSQSKRMPHLVKIIYFFGSVSELFLLLKEITKCSNRCISADQADAHFAGSQSRLLEISMLRSFLRDQRNVSK